jgi:hypothetical protein
MKTVVKMLMALPLLPAALMAEGLEVTQSWAERHSLLYPELVPVIDRLRNHWLGVIGADVISVYKRSTRTNNGLESSFKSLKDLVKKHRPPVYELIGKLLKNIIKNLLTVFKNKV